MIFRILAGIAAALALIIFAGVSGLSFQLWPTGVGDQTLRITPQLIAQLHTLKSENKFYPDPGSFYPGAPDEVRRAAAQTAVDGAIQSLLTELPRKPQRSTMLGIFKHTLANLTPMQSEERDQILVYLTRAMDICGVENSGELFNVWRYGFPYGWLI